MGDIGGSSKGDHKLENEQNSPKQKTSERFIPTAQRNTEHIHSASKDLVRQVKDREQELMKERNLNRAQAYSFAVSELTYEQMEEYARQRKAQESRSLPDTESTGKGLSKEKQQEQELQTAKVLLELAQGPTTKASDGFPPQQRLQDTDTSSTHPSNEIPNQNPLTKEELLAQFKASRNKAQAAMDKERRPDQRNADQEEDAHYQNASQDTLKRTIVKDITSGIIEDLKRAREDLKRAR